jgi:uncharacterized protein (DUF1330 family)
MALEVHEGAKADHFVVCLFKPHEKMQDAAAQFILRVEATVRGSGGKIQIKTDKPKEWELFDGKDNFTEPNHLNPAIFDFNCVMVAGFRNTHDVYAWWNSDPVFEILKYRSPVEKMGVYVVEGLQRSYDVSDHNKVAFGERLVFMEFINMQSFKPVQQYVDNYRIYAERTMQEIGIECNLLFSEGVSGVLMNEFPLDACVASFWRMKSDAQFFYDSESYQRQLLVLRRDYSRSFAMLCPMFDERAAMDAAFAKKRQLALEEKKKQVSRRPARGMA